FTCPTGSSIWFPSLQDDHSSGASHHAAAGGLRVGLKLQCAGVEHQLPYRAKVWGRLPAHGSPVPVEEKPERVVDDRPPLIRLAGDRSPVQVHAERTRVP